MAKMLGNQIIGEIFLKNLILEHSLETRLYFIKKYNSKF